MRTQCARVFALAICCFWPSLCLADILVPISQVRPLVDWVENRTNLMLLPRPKIYVSTEALLHLTSDTTDPTSHHERIAAYKGGVIFISEKYWELGDTADQSVIVHELVHYAQDVSGQHYACAAKREEEAYRLQNEFLLERGERQFVNEEDLERLGRCS